MSQGRRRRHALANLAASPPVEEVDRFGLADGSYQHALLRDAGRLEAYAAAIARVVRPGDVVADLGSGSGIMAWLAMRAGAARVHAVEANQPALAALGRLLERNGIADRVSCHAADAERWVPPEPVDVVVCELMETGLLHEPAAAAMAQVHRAWPRKPRALVPQAARLLVEGVALEDTFLGYAAPLPGFRGSGHGRALTDAACYLEVDFEAGPPPEGANAEVPLRAREAGRIAALRLRTLSLLAPGVEFETGPGYCTPVVLPLAEPLSVEAGQGLEAALAYTFAFDGQPLRYALRSAQDGDEVEDLQLHGRDPAGERAPRH